MKKPLLILCILGFIVSCKKDSKPGSNDNLNLTGKWTLYSWQETSTDGGFDAEVTQYPCIADNILQINADFTTNTSYKGKDTCYVAPPHSGRFSGSTFIGTPGQTPQSGIWSRIGNDIYISGEHYVISSSNGKLYLTTTAVDPQGGTIPVAITTKVVDVKE